MKYKFFRYSGAKNRYVDSINSFINQSNKTTYCEPFIGSGAVLFNLQKEFDKYIINDIDRNIIRIYKTFKEISYEYYIEKVNEIFEKFGKFTSDRRFSDKDTQNIEKENYYKFRNWFNENHWNTETIDEGIYIHILANSCINSMLRFGPNGMNQGYGNKCYILDKMNFERIHSILQKTDIFNVSYDEILNLYPDACYFLDPPYFSQGSSYTGFSENDLRNFISNIKNIEYVYTDILNDINSNLHNKKLIREMNSTSPLTNKSKNGNLEYLFFNIENYKENSDEW